MEFITVLEESTKKKRKNDDSKEKNKYLGITLISKKYAISIPKLRNIFFANGFIDPLTNIANADYSISKEVYDTNGFLDYISVKWDANAVSFILEPTYHEATEEERELFFTGKSRISTENSILKAINKIYDLGNFSEEESSLQFYKFHPINFTNMLISVTWTTGEGIQLFFDNEFSSALSNFLCAVKQSKKYKIRKSKKCMDHQMKVIEAGVSHITKNKFTFT